MNSKGKIKKLVLIAVFGIVGLSCLFLSANANFITKANKVAIVKEIADTYRLGEEVVIEKQGKIFVDGKEYRTDDASLTYPDGTVRGSGTHKLVQAGEYAVRYFYKDELAVSCVAEKRFDVVTKSWSVTSEMSSAEYTNLSGKFAGKTGINVNLVEGDSFCYNVPIDLTGKGLVDVISFFPNFSLEDRKDAYRITVRLTDAYDPSVYVDFVCAVPTESVKEFYFRAGASNQRISGMEKYWGEETELKSDRSKFVRVDGQLYLLHFENSLVSYGTPAGYYGPQSAPIVWKLDTENDCIYSKVGTRDTVPITKMSEIEFYGEDVFKGFTTGEVYLSLFASEYTTNFVNFQIASIFGVSEEGLKAYDYFDEKKPQVNIDVTETDGNGVYAVTGVPFEIFAAQATDINFYGQVTAKVFYNYSNGSGQYVPLQDGVFTPDKVGVYTIVYEAKDIFGNTGSSTIKVNSVKKDRNGRVLTGPIEIELAEQGDFSAGKEAYVPAYTCRGINGKIDVEISALAPNGTVIEIDSVTRKFLPLEAGEYEIAYRCRDNVFDVVKKLVINVKNSETIRFLDEPILYNHYIKGYEYVIEEFCAYEFSTGMPQKVPSSLQVRFDGGEWQNAEFSGVKIEGENTVQFKFSAAGAEDCVTRPYPIIETKVEKTEIIFGQPVTTYNTDYATYFVGDFARTSTSSDIEFVAQNTEGENTISYINPVSSRYFKLYFKIPAAAAYDSVRISLTGFYERDAALYFDVVNRGGKIELKTSFGVSVITTLKYGGEETLSLAYLADVGKFRFNETFDLAAEYPFERDACLLDVRLGGFKDGTGALTEDSRTFRISQICNNTFTSNPNDNSAPIIVAKPISGFYEKGDKATVYPAEAVDIVSPLNGKAVRVRVIFGTGGAVKASDGTLMDGEENRSDRQYELTLSEVGVYKVFYEITDSAGQTSQLIYNLTVVDSTVPKITLKGVSLDQVISVSVNEEYTLAGYSVDDEYDESEDIFVITYVVRDKDYSAESVTNGKFVPTRTGYYTVYYYCVDKAGNYFYVSYKLLAR